MLSRSLKLKIMPSDKAASLSARAARAAAGAAARLAAGVEVPSHWQLHASVTIVSLGLRQLDAVTVMVRTVPRTPSRTRK